MNATLENIVADLVTWLSQPLPIYWLVAALVVAIGILFFSWRNFRAKLTNLNTENAELSFIRAANSQKIVSLEGDKQKLASEISENSLRVEALTIELTKLKNSQNKKDDRLKDPQDHPDFLQAVLKENMDEIAELKIETKRQQALLSSEKGIEQRQKVPAEQNKAGIGSRLSPLKEQVKGFEDRVMKYILRK